MGRSWDAAKGGLLVGRPLPGGGGCKGRQLLRRRRQRLRVLWQLPQLRKMSMRRPGQLSGLPQVVSRWLQLGGPQVVLLLVKGLVTNACSILQTRIIAKSVFLLRFAAVNN